MSTLQETHLRSVAKAFSWRALALVITVCVVFFITGKPAFAAAIGLTDTVIKLGVYYAHERFWNHVCFGQIRPQGHQV